MTTMPIFLFWMFIGIAFFAGMALMIVLTPSSDYPKKEQ